VLPSSHITLAHIISRAPGEEFSRLFKQMKNTVRIRTWSHWHLERKCSFWHILLKSSVRQIEQTPWICTRWFQHHEIMWKFATNEREYSLSCSTKGKIRIDSPRIWRPFFLLLVLSHQQRFNPCVHQQKKKQK
jgi:hypothetical protein